LKATVVYWRLRRLRFSSDADIVRLTNARIIIIIIIIIIGNFIFMAESTSENNEMEMQNES